MRAPLRAIGSTSVAPEKRRGCRGWARDRSVGADRSRRPEYSVVVAGFNAQAGEGWRAEAAMLRQGEPLTFSVWDRGFSCPAGIAAATMTADWSITGGSAPYTISFGEGLGFETTDRWGSHEVDCGADPEGAAPGRQVIEVRVADSNGESRSQLFELRRQQIQDGEDPYALPAGLAQCAPHARVAELVVPTSRAHGGAALAARRLQRVDVRVR